MRTKERAGQRLTEKMSDVYLALMLSVFLLWPGTDGYAKITAAKYRLFLILTLGYCAGTALLYLELLVMRQHRPVSFRVLVRAVRPAEWLMLGYVLCSLLSALLSPWREDTWLGLTRREGFLTLALYAAVFLMLGRLARPKKWLLDIFGAGMCLCCLLAIWQLAGENPLGLYPEGLSYYDTGKAYSGAYLGTIGNTDLLAAVMCAAAPAFFYGAWKLRRYWLLAPLALCLTVSVWMDVSAGLLGTAAGLILPLPLALSGKKRRAAAIIIGCGLLASFFAVLLIPGLPGILGEAHALLHGRAEDTFGSGRVYIWRNVWQAVKERPLFGGGPDTLSRRITAYFERYDEAKNIVIRSGIDAAHNEYLNILANQGCFALLCWLGALGCSAVRFVRQAGERPAVLICGSAVLGYCVQAFFGISMCLSTPFLLIAWAMLENQESEHKR